MHFEVGIAAVKRYCEPVLLAKFIKHEVSRSLIESQLVKNTNKSRQNGNQSINKR
jgi:hypothetical protein